MKKSEVPQHPAFRQADVIASFVLSCVKSVWSKVTEINRQRRLNKGEIVIYEKEGRRYTEFTMRYINSEPLEQ